MTQPLAVALMWHMHQPYYRDVRTSECLMPWVRLHGTKDYLDMVALIEELPAARLTVNIVPSLADQILDYLPPHNRTDTFLDLSAKPAADLTESDRHFLLDQFFMANWEQMIKPHPRYHDLLAKRCVPGSGRELLERFKTQDWLDLQVWFNLVWIDPWFRRRDPDLQALEAKGSGFTEADKALVLAKQVDILARILPTYRRLQEEGRIELTCSPYYHPILPLVCDARSAHQALPGLPLPEDVFRHPEDAAEQLRRAAARHTELFGRAPQGLWPSEGSVSEEALQLAIQAGFTWAATDEAILWRTLNTAPSALLRYRPHLMERAGGRLHLVFRDRELSDLIGFVYSRWDPAAAVQDFLARLDSIRQQCRSFPMPPLVSIILDGENAWESYPDDGIEFLSGLYRALATDERFRMVTVGEYVREYPQQESLPPVFAGSWIDGNFATWIGHPEKNAAWQWLAAARGDLERNAASGQATPEAREQAWRSFFAAEGSDWMWWYGDTHSSAQDEEFDQLFRTHLKNVYRLLGETPPQGLDRAIKQKSVGGMHEPTASIHPVIDGLDTSYYEWLYAGFVDLRKGFSAIHRGDQLVTSLRYGRDASAWYLRLDLTPAIGQGMPGCAIKLELDGQSVVDVTPDSRATVAETGGPESVHAAWRRIVEIAVPGSLAGAGDQPLRCAVSLWIGGEMVERYPSHGQLALRLPKMDIASIGWSV